MRLWFSTPSLTTSWEGRLWRALPILLVCFFGMKHTTHAQSVLDQPVTLVAQHKSLEDCLYLLIDQYRLPLSFRNESIPDVSINVNLQQQPLAAVLKQLLEPYQLRYQLIGQQIVILPQRPPPNIEYTISGFVTDANSGEQLIGASIYDYQSGRGTICNEYGFFSLKLPMGSTVIQASYLGYQSRQLELEVVTDQSVNWRLKPSITLQEVVVYANDTVASPIAGLARGNEISLQETEILPSLAGEPDVLRAAHLLPGIKTGADGAEGLLVRGGGNGQNLVLLDGVPVYNASHGFGFFSRFNTSALRSVQILRGGFPARYGGRLSSVIDVRTKEGNLQEIEGSAEVGLLSARFSLEGPIVTDKTAFFVSGRWSFIHWFLRPQSEAFKRDRGERGVTDYRFYDLNAKVHHTFSGRDRLFLSMYLGRDSYEDDALSSTNLSIRQPSGTIFNYRILDQIEESDTWGNTVGSLRWNHLFSDELFANFSLTYSELNQESYFDQQVDILELNTGLGLRGIAQGRLQSGIQDWGLRADWQYFPRPGLQYRFGGGLSRRVFRPGALIVENDNPIPDTLVDDPIETQEVYAYWEGEGQFGERLFWNAGLHGASWFVNGTTYASVQPRASLDYRWTKPFSLQLSYSRMVQYLHLLLNTTIGLPDEFWVPSTENIEPARSNITALGFRYQLHPQWQLEGDVYYKDMRQLLAFEEGANDFRDWEANTTAGRGESYGVEVQLSKKQGALTGWLTYTYARAFRQFNQINLGRVYPFRYDREHDFKVAAILRLTPLQPKKGPIIHLSSNWLYASGFKFTIPFVRVETGLPGEILPAGFNPTVFDPESKNRYRMPAYHRLDINCRLAWPERNGVQHRMQIGVYNAYNRNNPLYYDVRRSFINRDNTLTEGYSFVEVQLTPILPTFSYQLRF